jgi:lipoprotein-anchoring transpeptidase ErfK/SrfK
MGGSILIHAWPESMPATLGCVGVRNADMEKLFDLAEPGMNILILPWSQVIRANGTFSLDPPPPDP